MQIGDIIEVAVTRIEPWGIGLEAEGIVGLVLIPDVSYRVVKGPNDYARVGEELTVKVLRFDSKNGNFIASRKELHPEEKVNTSS